MQFERLKKSHKKQIIMGALAICVIGGSLTFATTRAKYKLTQSIDLVKGTINYKPYDFKIMAMYKSDDGTNYIEITDRMPSNGYVINESKSYCTLDNKTHDTSVRLYTENGKHIFENLAKSDKCYLYFDKYVPTSEDTLTKLNITNYKTTTPTFANVALTDEGIFKVSDGMYGGNSYYWRGAVINNYVKFANFCWRIIRINGDGSIRMIYDGTTCHANGTSTTESLTAIKQPYYPQYDRSEYVGYTFTEGSQRGTSTESNLKKQNDTWFNTNITGTNLNKVADGKFCNDRNMASGYNWSSQPNSIFYYAGYERSGYNDTNQVNPTLSCPSKDIYTLKVGAITMDEVVMAGGNLGRGNNTYYLYNGHDYWTMTPYNCAVPLAQVFHVYYDGKLSAIGVHNIIAASLSVRPAINLKADTDFQIGGNGTQSNPYIIAD